MTNRQMFEKSFFRPTNFFELTTEQQWEIDKGLGILDWDGVGMTEDDLKKYYSYYGFIDGKGIIKRV